MIARVFPAVALALLAAPAFAGGFAPVAVVPAPAAPVVPVAPVAPSADWSGFYLGGQLGFGNLETDLESTEGPESAGLFEGSGAIAGIHAGYLFDFGRLVAGAEIDFDGAAIDLEGVEFAEGSGTVGSLDSIARAKLRLGFDAGRFMPYVTAGLARASFSYDDSEAGSILDDTATGPFVGIGASYAATDRFVIGIEALRHDLEGPNFPDEAAVDVSTELTTVTLRGSFRF